MGEFAIIGETDSAEDVGGALFLFLHFYYNFEKQNMKISQLFIQMLFMLSIVILLK